MRYQGGDLLQSVGIRITERYLRDSGAMGIMTVAGSIDQAEFAGVDVVCNRGGASVRIKVKADAYFGTDQVLIADKALEFYRGSSTTNYAFETISHHVTRRAGWMIDSVADELFYYFVAITQPEDEVRSLMESSDDVFFSGLAVQRDELHVLPMPALRKWFTANHERYAPRPVALGDHSGWYRIIPVADLNGSLPGAKVKAGVFAGLSRR